MRKPGKNATQIDKNWAYFFPYMRSGWKFMTKIGENERCMFLLKLSKFFPLYAKRPKFRDTNCSFLTHFFPLYAKWPGFWYTNDLFWWPKSWTYFDPLFYLICGLGLKTWPKVTKSDPIFLLYMQNWAIFVTRIVEINASTFVRIFTLICKLVKNMRHKSSKIINKRLKIINKICLSCKAI